MSKIKINKFLPELRFSEFKEDLQLTGFAELGAIKIGLTHTPTYVESGIPFLSSKNISNGYIDFVNIQFISEEEFLSMPESTKPKVGDILFTRVGSNLGNPIVLEEDRKFGIFVSLGIFRVNKKAYNYYIKYWMDSDCFWEQIDQKVAGGAKNNLNTTWLKEFKLAIPSIPEQQKIAYCLSTIDELIKTQSKKLETLQAHKKGLLQNLFPAGGETLPELRFPEFEDDGDWIEKTLGQVVHYENGKAHEQDIDEQGNYIVVNSKFISTDGEVKKYTNTAILPAKKGDILMVLSDVPNGRAIAKCFYVDKNDTYTVNQRICKLTSKKAVSLVLYYLINRNPYFLAFDDGAKQTNLRKDDVLNCPLLLPKNPKEQQKIADCLSSIDELINAQSQKIEALKNHKKGLMQQLFPNTNELINE